MVKHGIREGVFASRNMIDINAHWKALEKGCRFAVLKENSPSCGCGCIYDGTFTGRKIPGMGIAAGLLTNHGITVVGETGLEKLPDGAVPGREQE